MIDRVLRWFGVQRIPAAVPVAPPKVTTTPRLDRLLELLRDEIVRQGTREDGPTLDRTIGVSMLIRDEDPILKRVLEVKGGQLGIQINLTPEETEEQRLQRELFAAYRTQCGVQQPPELVARTDK